MKPDSIDKTEFTFVKERLKAGFPLSFKIISGSMEPCIMTGEEVTLEPVEFKNLRRFDIIILCSKNILVCHFVKHINSLRFNGGDVVVTRGVNASGDDFPVREEEILGRVISHQLSFRFKVKFLFQHLARSRRR